jgi:hypothetical protein
LVRINLPELPEQSSHSVLHLNRRPEKHRQTAALIRFLGGQEWIEFNVPGADVIYRPIPELLITVG